MSPQDGMPALASRQVEIARRPAPVVEAIALIPHPAWRGKVNYMILPHRLVLRWERRHATDDDQDGHEQETGFAGCDLQFRRHDFFPYGCSLREKGFCKAAQCLPAKLL